MAEAMPRKSSDKDNKHWLNLPDCSFCLSEDRKMVSEDLDDTEKIWPRMFTNHLNINTFRPRMDFYSRCIDVNTEQQTTAAKNLHEINVSDMIELQSMPNTRLPLPTIDSPLTETSIPTPDLLLPDLNLMTTRLTPLDWSSIGSLLSPEDTSSEDDRQQKDSKTKFQALPCNDLNTEKITEFSVRQESDEDACLSGLSSRSKTPTIEKHKVSIYIDESGNLLCKGSKSSNRTVADHKIIPSSAYEDAKSAVMHSKLISSPPLQAIKEVYLKSEGPESANNSDGEPHKDDGAKSVTSEKTNSGSSSSDDFKYYTLKNQPELDHSGGDRTTSSSSSSSPSSSSLSPTNSEHREKDLSNENELQQNKHQRPWRNLFHVYALRSRRKTVKSEGKELKETEQNVPKKRNGFIRIFNRMRQRLKKKKPTDAEP